MECGISSKIEESSNPDTSRLSNAFMFTEEQITKQLVDMKEQTDFMKRFRCALGIALREIKTLRTNSIHEVGGNFGDDAQRKATMSCSLTTSSNSSNSGLQEISPSEKPTDKEITSEALNAGHHQCLSADIGSVDLRILRDYLSKMEMEDESNRQYLLQRKIRTSRCNSMERIKDDSKILIDKSIGHIERLKDTVAQKNDHVKKLCQRLTQARLVRVKRETKLEQKLLEIEAWKEKYDKIKKSNDKQVHISRTLRVALNAERSKVQSSENMALGLEETRKAFNSLKSQAGRLMESLQERDREIEALTKKLAEADNRASLHHSTPLSHVIQVSTQTDLAESCFDCSIRKRELESLKVSYSRLMDDFDRYRRNCEPNTSYSFVNSNNPIQASRDYPQNHPYGRRRMHAPYTSPESYRRVSRPPLRRRLNYGGQFSYGNQTCARTNGKISGDTLLSPIDEFVENTEDDRSESVEPAEMATQSTPKSVRNNLNATTGYEINDFRQISLPPELSTHHETNLPRRDNLSLKKSDKSIRSADIVAPPSDLASKEAQHFSANITEAQQSAETSYLELGHCETKSSNDSLEQSKNVGSHPLLYPQVPHAFIRRSLSNEVSNLDPEQSNMAGEEDDMLNTPQSPVPLDQISSPYGVLWHPALQENTKKNTSADNEITMEKLEISQEPVRLALFGSDNVGDNDKDKLKSNAQKSKPSKHEPHFVTYKGHKIDVTEFSMHGFRNIVWSLDGGSETADDFIKFLASTTKKLNASPKWAGKHSMGNPDDWLALRGMF